MNGPIKDDIKRCTCLAISSDGGHTFTKPNLGLVSFNGSTQNNIVMPRNKTSWSSGTVFEDENPAAPPDEKFKLIALWNPDTHKNEDDGQTWTFASPDGIDFHPLSAGPVYKNSDTQDVALFDPSLGKYIAFRRLHQPQSRQCATCAGTAIRHAPPPSPPSHWKAFGCAYQHGNNCPAPSAPLKCTSTADCNPLNFSDPTCDGVRISCLPSGVCGAAGKGAGGIACMEHCVDHTCTAVDPSAPPGWCGTGSAAERFVGRCETDDLREIVGCDEGLPANQTKYTTSFGPDADDSPCVDIYTNQIVIYEGVYLAFPGAYEHFPEPPAWPVSNDGWYDTRILASRNGATNWSYVANDRGSFMGRGHADAPPLPASSGCLNCSDPRTWRESMVAAVRGLVVTETEIKMFAWGGRCRHGQDLCGAYDEGGDGAIAPVTIRRDGFGSIGSASTSWREPGLFTTTLVKVTGNTLLLNAVSSNGGGIRVAILPKVAATTTPAANRSLAACLKVGSDVLSAPVTWGGAHGAGGDLSDLLGQSVQLQFELISAQLFSYRFE